ncbi:MAG: hypothetical protein KUG65_09070 [Sphingomonadaceae bacterium]|nr:hypothetical protein [Sphingomonadaceae bacterium]
MTGAPNITTDSAVFVERMDTDLGRQLEPAENLARGDRVVTILRWYRLGGDGDFVITNSLPRTISYQQSSRRDEEVSVNGGKKWGPLGALRVGSRMATPEDVTHVRWRISQRMASIGKGQIAYSGIVR